jgi:tetratricopeptide (TPR) repeat protein
MALSSEVYNRCRELLLQCSEFESYDSLKTLFAITELSDYKANLPEAKTKADRVDATIAYLEPQRYQGQSVLAIFLRQLAFRQPLGDSRKIELDGLIDIIQKLPSDSSPNIVNTINTNYQRTCPKPRAEPQYFDGRDRVLDNLTAELKTEQNGRIITVVGLGGIGKTTLADKIAYDLYHQKVFRTVLWADIGKEPQTINILQNWADYAGSAFQAGDRPLKDVASHVKVLLSNLIDEKCQECPPLNRILVVLDDVWEEEASLEAARTLIQACPDKALILITTRSKNVAIQGLQLNKDQIYPLDKLAPDDAVSLLQARLGKNNNYNPDQLRDLAILLDGYTLALVLAAVRETDYDNNPNTFPERLEEYRKGMTEGVAFSQLELDYGEERNESLEVTLQLSYNHLDPIDQKRFRAIGALAYGQPFDTVILAAIWDMDETAVQKYLAKNSSPLRSLLLIEPNTEIGAGENWYKQHQVIQTYAKALLKAADNGKELEAVEYQYQKHITEIITPKFWEFPTDVWSEKLTPYLPHVHNVGDQLVKALPKVLAANKSNQSIETTAKLYLSQEFAFNVSRYLDEKQEVHQLDWLGMGLASSKALNDKGNAAKFLNDIGGTYGDWGDKNKALEYYQQALLLHREIGAKGGEAVCLNNIGAAYAHLGYKDRALEYYEQALPLHQTSEDKNGEATTLINIGATYSDIGYKDRALRYYEQALILSQTIKDTRRETAALNHIGAAYSDLGDKNKALEYYDRALILSHILENKSAEAETLYRIGEVYDDLGDSNKALGYYEVALTLFRKVGDLRSEGMTLNNIGVAHTSLKNFDTALRYYDQALAIHRTVGNRNAEATTLHNLGEVQARSDNRKGALKYYNQALPIRRAVGDKSGEAMTLVSIGRAYTSLGDNSKALEYFKKALSIRKTIGDKSGEAITNTAIARVYYKLGQLEKAIEYLQDAVQLQTQIQDPNIAIYQAILMQWQQELIYRKNKK